MMRVWLCEKRDQAQNLAPLLGNPKSATGYFETNDGRVTWAIGHLLQLPAPEGHNPEWSEWTMSTLPMVPACWDLVPDPDKARQLAVVLECLKRATEVVVATDYGAEGEAIARELLDHAGYAGPVRRLKYAALDDVSLKSALSNILDGSVSEPLYWASQARSRADWLVGMNLSRAYTLRARATGAKGTRSVGRVQTPTLAMVVRRDREIADFKSRSFYDIEVLAKTRLGVAVTLRDSPSEASRIYDRAQAEELVKRLAGRSGLLRVQKTDKAKQPPKLLDLLGFTKLASKAFGWKADYALRIAQALYDKKLTTYPRTDCVLLPNEHESEIPGVLAALGKVPPLARHVGALVAKPPIIRKNVFNTAEVNKHEHHAIRPTAVDPSVVALEDDEKAGYTLIALRYLAALMPDYQYQETRIAVDAGDGVELAAIGNVPVSQGWQSVYGKDPDAEHTSDGSQVEAGELPAVPDGTSVDLESPSLIVRKTTPPSHYTDGTLIEDMASVAKYASDPAVKARLKETSGLGTSATRAEVIATLRKRGYIEDKGKSIVSTAIGRELIDAIPPSISDPAMTALWEDRLTALRRGELPVGARDEFVAKIAGNIAKLIDRVREEALSAAAARLPSESQVRYARSVASALGIALPDAAEGSYGVLAAFLEQHGPAYAALPPTPAQLAFAEKVAQDSGVDIPEAVRTQRGACGAWLDVHAPKAKPAAKASNGGKQLKPKALPRKSKKAGS